VAGGKFVLLTWGTLSRFGGHSPYSRQLLAFQDEFRPLARNNKGTPINTAGKSKGKKLTSITTSYRRAPALQRQQPAHAGETFLSRRTVSRVAGPLQGLGRLFSPLL
jgi:hypothetical protein